MLIRDYSCILSNILSHQAFCRPSGCFLQSRKYSVARQSTQSCRGKHPVARQDALSSRGITNLGQEWSFSDWRKYSVARQSTQSCRSKHRVGRHDALSNRGITNLGQEWSFSDRSKYSVVRQSTRSYRSKHPVARQDAFSICASTLSAVGVLLPQYVKDRAAKIQQKLLHKQKKQANLYGRLASRSDCKFTTL